jgi:hypothetical protein
MALDVENLNAEVSTNLDSQAPSKPVPEQLASDAAKAIPGETKELRELRELRDEVASLKRAAVSSKAEAEDRESDLRIKAAKAIAHKPVPAVRSNVQVDLAFAKLRSELGGNCFLKNLTPVQQLEAIGFFGTESIKDKEVQAIVGRTSDGAKANALRRSDPERYALLRAVGLARGLC